MCLNDRRRRSEKIVSRKEVMITVFAYVLVDHMYKSRSIFRPKNRGKLFWPIPAKNDFVHSQSA